MSDTFQPHPALAEGAAPRAAEPLQIPELDKLPPTDYGKFVVDAISHMTRNPLSNGRLNQENLRNCLAMASSFMIADTTLNSESGIDSWTTGFKHLVELLLHLHRKGDLDPATMGMSIRACYECWVAIGSFQNLDRGRAVVQECGSKLRACLDEPVPGGGAKYKGVDV